MAAAGQKGLARAEKLSPEFDMSPDVKGSLG